MSFLFRSTLGGGEANYDNFGANVGGNFLPPEKLQIPPALFVASDPMNFNGLVTIGDYVTDCPEFFAWLPNFNYPVNIPSNTLNLHGMFNGASSFNQPINLPISENANIPNVPVNLLTADLDSMFQNSAFNQPINNFPTYFTGVSMFEDTPFNSPIDFSNSNAFSLERMFYNCQEFNQPVEICNVFWQWDWANLGMIDHHDTSLNEMFANCVNFNSPVTFNNSSNISGVLCFNRTFANSAFNCPIDFSKLGHNNGQQPRPYQFIGTFYNTPFNQPIVFPYLEGGRYACDEIYFYRAFGDNFNQPIYIDGSISPRGLHPYFMIEGNFVPQNFDQSVNIGKNLNCTDFSYGFESCYNLNHPINLPTFVPMFMEESGAECSINYLFSGCANFNQPLAFNFEIDRAYVGANIYMESSLQDCINFNAPVIFNMIIPSTETPTRTVNIYASGFFAGCENFNPNLDDIELYQKNFLPNYIVDASDMFCGCYNFNVNSIFIPLWAENCSYMFGSCNHINRISLIKTDDFDFSNFDLTGFLAGTDTNSKCEIITYQEERGFNTSLVTYEKVLEADLFDEGSISWTNESWGSYNTYYNLYVIQDYNNYVNWTP